ncbi:MAG: hypothetical protein KDM63_18535, partial [Verrucomicrobiae bacterium]|nr:hypothetical protein [Verrucomicrobiae bacterium]
RYSVLSNGLSGLYEVTENGQTGWYLLTELLKGLPEEEEQIIDKSFRSFDPLHKYWSSWLISKFDNGTGDFRQRSLISMLEPLSTYNAQRFKYSAIAESGVIRDQFRVRADEALNVLDDLFDHRPIIEVSEYLIALEPYFWVFEDVSTLKPLQEQALERLIDSDQMADRRDDLAKRYRRLITLCDAAIVQRQILAGVPIMPLIDQMLTELRAFEREENDARDRLTQSGKGFERTELEKRLKAKRNEVEELFAVSPALVVNYEIRRAWWAIHSIGGERAMQRHSEFERLLNELDSKKLTEERTAATEAVNQFLRNCGYINPRLNLTAYFRFVLDGAYIYPVEIYQLVEMRAELLSRFEALLGSRKSAD